MKLFTIVGLSNTSGERYVKHLMATDASTAVAMAAESEDFQLIAIFNGWQESLIGTDGPPREAADLLDTDFDV